MAPRSHVIATGSELVTGQVQDRNGPWLARALLLLGFPAEAISCVPDDSRLLRQALETALRSGVPAVVLTGGLGPTEDDVTRAAVSEFAGVPQLLHQGAEAALREFLARMHREATPAQLRQVTLPAGAVPIPNPAGTAPGFFIDARGLRVIAFPGPPAELEATAGANLEGLSGAMPGAGSPVRILRLDVVGVPEPEVDTRIDGARAVTGVAVGTLASEGAVAVVLAARGQEAEASLARAREAVAAGLGDSIFGEGGKPLAEVVVGLFIARGLTLSTAESCTGGLVGHLLTQVPGASAAFMQGVIAYANEVKIRLLGVPEELIRDKGAVSAEVAVAMAQGAVRSSGADAGAGITGIAGPSGGTPEKPVGLVYVAVAHQGQVTVRRLDLGAMRRDWIKRRSAMTALDMLRRAALGLPSSWKA